MIREGAASRAVKEQLEQVVLDDLKGEGPRQLSERIQADRARRKLEGKPITIAGETLDGKPFSTEAWKGRVVVVDFWGTWCEPCKRELPALKAVYDRHHDRGLEVVGVPSDRKGELTAFLNAHKDVVWPQLPMKGPPGFHKLAKDYELEVSGIPARFVIDREGVLRSVDARDNLEELVAKLIEEKK
jgi:thiol-disulfide isomerase/thioredoxin